MVTITHYRWHEMEVDDPRDVREAKLRNKITLKTSERVNWTTLRKMSPVPQWNSQHPTEPGFYLDFIEPNHKSRLIWELECEYTVFAGGQVDPDPLSRPASVTFSASLVEEPSLFDADGRPTVNRAGEFVQGLVRQVPIVEYTFRKNYPSDPRWIQSHLGAVNSDSIKIRGIDWRPNTLLLASVAGGDFTEENRSRYTEISGTVLADPRGWTQQVWNRGTVQLKQVERTFDDPTAPSGIAIRRVWTQVPIVAGSPPEPVSEPVPLDEDGRSIIEAVQPSRTEPLPKGRLITLDFNMQPRVAFSELPLR